MIKLKILVYLVYDKEASCLLRKTNFEVKASFKKEKDITHAWRGILQCVRKLQNITHRNSLRDWDQRCWSNIMCIDIDTVYLRKAQPEDQN